MTNTKFRRRALVSSIAMLLVALVALGSATFAWFTENPAVYAQGITAEAQTSAGLMIKTDTDPTFQEGSAQLMKVGGGLKLAPAYAKQVTSPSNSISWLTVPAGSADSWEPSGTWSDSVTMINATSSQGNTLGAGVYHEKVYIKIKNGTAAEHVNLTGITISEANNAPAIKSGVTVLVAASNQIKAVKKIGANPVKVDANAADSVAAITSGWTNYTMYADTSVDLGEAGTTDANALVIDVYVYLDGTDTNVKTNAAEAGQLISGITVNFAKA